MSQKHIWKKYTDKIYRCNRCNLLCVFDKEIIDTGLCAIPEPGLNNFKYKWINIKDGIINES